VCIKTKHYHKYQNSNIGISQNFVQSIFIA
jgi:hypothetical protein